MGLNKKYNVFSKYFILVLFSLFPFLIYQATNASYIREKESNNNSEIYSKNIESEYLLDAGDDLFINFNGIDSFSDFYNISPDGFLNLPELVKVNASGLTIRELEKELISKFDKTIIDPSIQVYVSKFRPVNVYLSGEIKNPGLYKLDYIYDDSDSTTKSLAKVTQSPKIFDLLQIAQGITNKADLSKVEIIRKNSISQGGGKIKAEINLIALLLEGDQTQNVRLLDGDHIIVKTSNNILRDQVLAINKTNISPDFITVYITGNLYGTKGAVQVKRGTSLIQAIASNGGKRILTGNVEFIRFKNDGTTQKRSFRYNANAQINTASNPILNDGDIVNVRKSILGKTTEILGEISSPILSGYGLFNLIN